MTRFPLTQATALIQEANGTARVPGTRVTLDTLVAAFREGATAEQIQDSYPSLSLIDIDSAFAYYQKHTSEVEEYLAQRGSEAAAFRAEIDARQDTATLRARACSARRDR